jgi:3'(2'), 5'-bisphosphate nucleotidase
MVRTCLDLTPWTKTPRHQFDLFYRRDQKIWDAATGIGLCAAMGRVATDGAGRDPAPFSEALLSTAEPSLRETVTGAPHCVKWFEALLATSRPTGELR